MLKLVVGIKPSDSSVVICYQADEFTHTWSMEHFVIQITILSLAFYTKL